MKKQFIILLTSILLFVGFNVSAVQDYTPIINSVDLVAGYGKFYVVEDPFQCYPSQIEKSGKIYPGSRIRIGGIQLEQGVQQFVNVYLNDEIIFTPDSFVTYKYFSNSCIDISLPQNISTGQNCIIFENGKKLKSEEFCFEVSQNICEAKDWKCENWGICNADGTQKRECNLLSNCENPEIVKPSLTQSCIPQCREDKWKCGEWSSCSLGGQQTRICIKDYDCPLTDSQSPATTQSCSYTPVCSADTWQCGNWGTCSPQGIQTRSCDKTFDCSSVETAAPATSLSCEVSKTPPSNSNDNPEGEINRGQILKSTVKLKCPIDEQWVSQGSGTIIDEYGTILTNKHVVSGTIGSCYVGFIYNEDDTPSYNEIADVKKISSDSSANGDMAILKIRNNTNKKFEAINIFQGDSSNLKSGDSILPFGYPNEDLFGATITFTEGPYSGKGTTLTVCGSSFNVNKFFKTTATIDHGNSGGGAYQKKTGYFMGIPTLGTSCKPEIPSRVNYILSINTIKSWLNSLGGGYSMVKNNFSNLSNYYKEIIPIEKINLNLVKIADTSIESANKSTDSKPTTNDSQNLTDKNIAKRLGGKILLQVESHGEAWYINPKTGGKHYMANGAEAYKIMRNLGVGITNKNLEKIKSNKTFAKSNSGKIFLQVESHGEAYYIDFNGNVNYLKDGNAAYTVMRNLGLGITNNDLSKISEGSL